MKKSLQSSCMHALLAISCMHAVDAIVIVPLIVHRAHTTRVDGREIITVEFAMFATASRRVFRNAASASACSNNLTAFFPVRCMSSIPSTMKVSEVMTSELSTSHFLFGYFMLVMLAWRAVHQRIISCVHTCDRAPSNPHIPLSVNRLKLRIWL